MSFDLYVFDVIDLPDDEDLIGELLEDESGWQAALTPRLLDLVAELRDTYPGLDEDPDRSPWASWPLEQPVDHGRGCAFNLTWSSADSVAPIVRGLALGLGLTVYDPQGSRVFRPSDEEPPTRRRWWRRG